jgi:hypothetical protein
MYIHILLHSTVNCIVYIQLSFYIKIQVSNITGFTLAMIRI